MRTVLPQIVELYEIIADTIHTLTTSREPVLWRGAEWTPAAVERGELRGSVDGKAATVTLTACMDTLLTRYLASLPILPTRVNIYEHEPESGDTVQVFGGVVLEVIPGADATQVSVNCLSSSCILDAMLPRMIYSGQCQFVLFDSGCGLAAQSWGVTASVSVDGYLLASPSFAAYPNGYFTRGYAAAGGDFRFIVAHGGDTITLQLPFDSRVGNGGTVTAYPGCDGSPATCRDRFGNSSRFGGCASRAGTPPSGDSNRKPEGDASGEEASFPFPKEGPLCTISTTRPRGKPSARRRSHGSGPPTGICSGARGAARTARCSSGRRCWMPGC